MTFSCSDLDGRSVYVALGAVRYADGDSESHLLIAVAPICNRMFHKNRVGHDQGNIVVGP